MILNNLNLFLRIILRRNLRNSYKIGFFNYFMERIILTEKNFSKLKEQVKNNRGKEIIFSSTDDDLNRKAVEKLPLSGVLVLLDDRKDYLKQRDSGLNEVICRILSKNKMKLYISFDEFFNHSHRERIISRLIQNIFLCSKVNVQIKFIFDNVNRDENEVKGFFASLGAPTWMVKNCI
jgi:RNase P/RNase MRP subunit p30